MTTQANDDPLSPAETAGAKDIEKGPWYVALGAVLLVLAAVVVISWGRLLHCYFFNDDLIQMSYLYDVFHGHLDWIWETFISVWYQHRAMYLFYRPIVQMSLFIDYLIWHSNPFGYHLSLLVYHGLVSVMIVLVTRELLDWAERWTALYVGFVAAAMFAAYPLHDEALAWIMSRTPLAGFFLLAALWLFMRWYKSRSRLSYILGTVSFVLGLLSKETAICLVPMVMFYFLMEDESPLLYRPLNAIKDCIALIAAAAVCLLARFLSLGTVIGGYIGSLGAVLNSTLSDRIELEKPFWQLLYPFNAAAFGAQQMEHMALTGLYCLVALLLVVTAANLRKLRSLFIIVVWLGLSLAPAFQIWGINSTHVGSRNSYIPLCFVSMFLSLGIYQFTELFSRRWLTLALRTMAVLASLALVLLFVPISRTNCETWLQASDDLKALQAAIVQRCREVPQERRLVLFALPYLSHGCIAIATAKMLAGLVHPPLTDVDLSHRFVIIELQPLMYRMVSSAQLKRLIAQKDRYDFDYWDGLQGRLVPIKFQLPENKPDTLALVTTGVGKFAQGDTLHPFVNKTRGSDFDSYRMEAGERIFPLKYNLLDVETHTQCGPYPEQRNALASWDTQTPLAEGSANPVQDPVALGNTGRLVFPLSEFASWLISDPPSILRLDMPALKCSNRVQTASLLSGRSIIPELEPDPKDELLADGSYKFRKEGTTLTYNASDIRGGEQVLVEVSRPYFFFAHFSWTYRDTARSEYAQRSTMLASTQGTIAVTPEWFKEPGAYQIRIATMDKMGEIYGTFSDPLTYTVDTDSLKKSR